MEIANPWYECLVPRVARDEVLQSYETAALPTSGRKKLREMMGARRQLPVPPLLHQGTERHSYGR